MSRLDRVVYLKLMDRKRLIRAARDLGLILLISFALGEMALRIVDHFNPSFVFHDSSYNRFRAAKGSTYYGFPINSRGFHDVEFAQKSDHVYRILALGDSFAFGIVPYEHNYLTLLEEQLSRPDRPVEVLNMGIPRTSPLDHLALLVNEGLELEPDLVLLSFFSGNDLLEIYREIHEKRPFYSRSHVLTLMRYAVFVRPQTEPGVLRNRRTYRDDQPTFGPDSHLEILGANAIVYLTGWEGFAQSIDAATAAIERMAEMCRTRDIALTVLLLPEETQVDTDLQRVLSTTFDLYPEDSMDFQLPNRTLQKRLTTLDIDHLDLLPAFQAGAQTIHLYKPRDTHWNIAGNRLAANTIASYLLNLGLPGLTEVSDGSSGAEAGGGK